MNQSSIASKVATLIALPAVVTILLNIVGEDGIGPLSDSGAINIVVVSALGVVVFLQTRLSINKIRTLGIHATTITIYVLIIILEHRDEHHHGNVTNLFFFSRAEILMLFLKVHTIASYIVLATKTIARLYTRTSVVPRMATSPTVTETASNAIGAKNSIPRLNVWTFALLGVIELYSMPTVTMSFSSITENTQIPELIIMLTATAFHIYIQWNHSRNWKQTKRIHAILGGIAAVLFILLPANGESASERFESSAMFVATLYWVVSYITLGIIIYLSTLKHSSERSR